jgi:hypothetical protein
VSVERIHKRHQDLDAGVPFEKFSYISLTNTYLFASFAYYERNVSLLADGTFDKLCKYLYNDSELLAAEGVWHVGTVILEDNLQAGTCLGVVYPDTVKQIAEDLIRWKETEEL